MVINKIREDLLVLAQTILEDNSISNNTKVEKNTLKNSDLYKDLYTQFTADIAGGVDPVIQALFNNYVEYIEWDRPPRYGKRPPISVLRDWAASNGFPTDVSTLWAISTAIWRDGHAGRPIFATLDKETDTLFNDDWSEWLFDAITEDLDRIFNVAA